MSVSLGEQERASPARLMNVIHVNGRLNDERREEVTAAWRTGCGVGCVTGCGGCCSVHLRECLLLMEVMAVSVLQMMMSVRLQVMSYLLLLLLQLLRVVVTVRMRLLLVAVSERCGVRLSDVLLLLLQCQRVCLLWLLLLLLWLQECTKQMLHSTATDGRGGGRVAADWSRGRRPLLLLLLLLLRVTSVSAVK